MQDVIDSQPYELPSINHYPDNPLVITVNFNELPNGVTAAITELKSGVKLSNSVQPSLSVGVNKVVLTWNKGQLLRLLGPVSLEFSWDGSVKMVSQIKAIRDPKTTAGLPVITVNMLPDGISFTVNISELPYVNRAENAALVAEGFKNQSSILRDEMSDLLNDAIEGLPGKVDKVTGKSLILDTLIQKLSDLPTNSNLTTTFGLYTTLAYLQANYSTTSVVNAAIQSAVNGLIASAPGFLDTFNEIAAALGNDPNFAATILNSLNGKVDKVDGKALSDNNLTNALVTAINNATAHLSSTNNPHSTTAAQVGAYKAVDVNNYDPEALAEATGSTKKIIRVREDETDSYNTNYYYYEGTAGDLTLQF